MEMISKRAAVHELRRLAEIWMQDTEESSQFAGQIALQCAEAIREMPAEEEK